MPHLTWPRKHEREPDSPSDSRVARDRAFDALFDQQWNAVFRYCYYRLGDWHAAEDAASQTFLNAYAAWDRFETRDDQRATPAWLFTIAHRVVANAYRDQSRHPRTPLDASPDQADWQIGPEDAALANEEHRTVRALLEKLPPEQREMMELRLAGLNHVEIADVLGKSPAAVRKAQSRAIFAMRDQLGLTPATQTGGSDV